MSKRQKDMKEVMWGVVIGQEGELSFGGPRDLKHRWERPDGAVLWAVGWMASEETWILPSLAHRW